MIMMRAKPFVRYDLGQCSSGMKGKYFFGDIPKADCFILICDITGKPGNHQRMEVSINGK